LSILIIDDEEILQDVLTSLLRNEGYSTLNATTAQAGLDLLVKEEVELVLLDLMLPDMSGIEVLKRIRAEDPDQVVVVITAYSSIEGAIEAMREGAFHYIPKPFKNEEVLLTIRHGLERRRLTSENRQLRAELRQRYAFDNIIGKSKPMQKVFELIQLAAPAKSNILILGESGTGKELVSKSIHLHSRRADGPFVTVNSGSMPADLLESNLFGHVKGSFTGAVANKKGLFELAHGGSIFFDEIGNIPIDTQSKLLRVIQEKEFMRLGGIETQTADVRIIAATNANLEQSVQKGEFREDLYYRLNVITIGLPPLKQRTEDIPLLARTFLAKYAEENEKHLDEIEPAAMEILMDYHWPGNVRELENVIERAVVLTKGTTIKPEALPGRLREAPAEPLVKDQPPANPALEVIERAYIEHVLRAEAGNKTRAAEVLGIDPSTLYRKIKRYELQV